MLREKSCVQLNSPRFPNPSPRSGPLYWKGLVPSAVDAPSSVILRFAANVVLLLSVRDVKAGIVHPPRRIELAQLWFSLLQFRNPRQPHFWTPPFPTFGRTVKMHESSTHPCRCSGSYTWHPASGPCSCRLPSSGEFSQPGFRFPPP